MLKSFIGKIEALISLWSSKITFYGIYGICEDSFETLTTNDVETQIAKYKTIGRNRHFHCKN